MLNPFVSEDNMLFFLIKKRDKQAFAAVYQKYHPYLYTLALKFLKKTEMAEDAVQHVFVKLWETSKNIEIEINLKNYLYTMTKNYILNQFRNNRETVSLNYINSQIDISGEENLEGRIEKNEIYRLLHQGIDRLPPQKREICRLKLQENLSNPEIARRMNISIHTVKSHYQESVRMLRNYFEKIDR